MIDSGRSRNSDIHIRLLRRCALAAICGALAVAASAVTLTVLHTSDLHGHVDPHDEVADRDYGEGLARVATAVAAARSEGRPTLLVYVVGAASLVFTIAFIVVIRECDRVRATAPPLAGAPAR